MIAVRKLIANWLPAYAFLYVVFLYLPVLLLPIFSFNTAATPKFPLNGFTLKWYEDLPKTPALLDAAWNSAVVGVAAAILSTVLGICAARAITRYRFPGRRAVSGLIMAPLVLPEIIVAVSLLIVLLQMGLSLSLFTVVLGHVLICVPYSVTVLTSGFEGFDRSLEEASADLGETAFGTFRRVTLPMVAPAIISSLLVSFTISLDEFIMAFFLTGTGRDAAGLYLGPAAFRGQAARRSGARHAASGRLLPPAHPCRNLASPGRQTSQSGGQSRCLTAP